MHSRGFTLIELVMVLVLMGIIAVVVAPKLTNVNATRAGAFSDKLRADIRYAQNLAMTRNARFRVYFNTAPSPVPGYAITNNAGVVVSDPAGGGIMSTALNAGDYAGIGLVSPAAFIEFDSLGRPYDAGGNLIAAPVVVNVAPGGSSVTIVPGTGTVN